MFTPVSKPSSTSFAVTVPFFVSTVGFGPSSWYSPPYSSCAHQSVCTFTVAGQTPFNDRASPAAPVEFTACPPAAVWVPLEQADASAAVAAAAARTVLVLMRMTLLRRHPCRLRGAPLIGRNGVVVASLPTTTARPPAGRGRFGRRGWRTHLRNAGSGRAGSQNRPRTRRARGRG